MHEGDLSSSSKQVLLLGFLLLETDLLLELRSLDDLARRRSNLRVQHLKIWKTFPATGREDSNSSNESPISTSWIHNTASDGKSEQVVAWFWNRIFQTKNVEHRRICRIAAPKICCLCFPTIGILRKFHRYWRTHSRRPSCKRRHWNCALILLAISFEKSFISPCCWRNWSSFSLWCARLNSLTMISDWIKRWKLITKIVFLFSQCIPWVKKQAFVAAQHGTRNWNRYWLTGNVRQSPCVIRTHLLKPTWNIHGVHLFLHGLQLWSEPLNCLLTCALTLLRLVVLELFSFLPSLACYGFEYIGEPFPSKIILLVDELVLVEIRQIRFVCPVIPICKHKFVAEARWCKCWEIQLGVLAS